MSDFLGLRLEANVVIWTKKMVPRARIELALPKKPDFESGASTSSATPAHLRRTSIKII